MVLLLPQSPPCATPTSRGSVHVVWRVLRLTKYSMPSSSTCRLQSEREEDDAFRKEEDEVEVVVVVVVEEPGPHMGDVAVVVTAGPMPRVLASKPCLLSSSSSSFGEPTPRRPPRGAKKPKHGDASLVAPVGNSVSKSIFAFVFFAPKKKSSVNCDVGSSGHRECGGSSDVCVSLPAAGAVKSKFSIVYRGVVCECVCGCVRPRARVCVCLSCLRD